MRVLGLVPARGGSKGVPRKNIRMLGGQPLLQYTAKAALASRLLTKTIISTEDEEIAQVGRLCGLEAPFLRPVELAEDTTPTLPVVQHAVLWLERHGEVFDAICLLQPTNPFRTAEDIDACIELMERSGSDSVISVLPIPAQYHPYWVYLRDESGRLRLSNGEAAPLPRRQELPPAFHREGSVYVTRRDVLIDDSSLYGKHVEGYLVDARKSINIDDLNDWAHAESMVASNRN
jgi:CMP-N,N'-diacetyllegionaminic acid synthase